MVINLTSLSNIKNGIDCSYNPNKPEIYQSNMEIGIIVGILGNYNTGKTFFLS